MNDTAIRFSGVAKHYGAAPVLDSVDLRVEAGECVALVGVNGAGKTSLLRCLLDFTRPTAGTIEICGIDHRNSAARAPLGYLPERFAPPYYLTGRDFLRYMLRLHGLPYDEAAALELLAELDLDPAILAKGARQLSKGMAQKLGLAACILADKRLYILDEPASGLDPKARALVKRQLARLRERGRTVFFTSHALADVEELCDRVAILDRGRLLFTGTPSDCRARYDAGSLEQAFLRCIH
ncbi:MAG TPA: ABC transporter ATP-binding protein [Telluria sp.]|nr:ABC transporter ATP-binding protein [Telluria sp.]